MNDKQFGFLKLLKLKYRRGDQKIPVFSRGVLENWFPPRNQAPPPPLPLFNLRKFYIREENVVKLQLIYTKQPVGLPNKKKQKFNHP